MSLFCVIVAFPPYPPHPSSFSLFLSLYLSFFLFFPPFTTPSHFHLHPLPSWVLSRILCPRFFFFPGACIVSCRSGVTMSHSWTLWGLWMPIWTRASPPTLLRLRINSVRSYEACCTGSSVSTERGCKPPFQDGWQWRKKVGIDHALQHVSKRIRRPALERYSPAQCRQDKKWNKALENLPSLAFSLKLTCTLHTFQLLSSCSTLPAQFLFSYTGHTPLSLCEESWLGRCVDWYRLVQHWLREVFLLARLLLTQELAQDEQLRLAV